MKQKIGWILFAIMAVAVIVLSSVLIIHNKRWKSGDELWDIEIGDIQSAQLYHDITSNAQPERIEYDLNEAQIEYIVKEFLYSKFERRDELGDCGASGVVFTLKDGSKREFYVIAGIVTIDGKKYKCHSYLTKYIMQYGSN